MIYTALGDSITFGENASSWEKAYPQLVVSSFNAGSHTRKVRGYVLAHPGWSSADLLDAVIWKGGAFISRSDVVSVWIGGVDIANAALVSLRNRQPFAADQVIANYRRNLDAILARIKKGGRARIVCCTQYNPFPNSPVSYGWIDKLNRTTSELAQSRNVIVAPVHTWFEGKQAEWIYGYRNGKLEDALSGFLPIHPNDRGHRAIVSRLAPYLFPRE
ncbi:SGNH/GDSL hydrolase family protein [Paenibacillus thermotolerans]|uniref:SGNH/GDSL hydrolase family protein n=1 Tax=Paenibacillus thermotolerans TaxID=3027807 RepID=UPI00236898BA|nr:MULTISPECIES: SGNH/GDSL hydrolase family protein [unclassified Paenibacillus]